MQEKIALLMEETGCDRGEAELALEMCGYEVEEAVKAIGRLLRNIVVIKGKFMVPEASEFGLFLVILNIKAFVLLRCRAVLSFNPAVFSVPLEKGWFEYEKALYGGRLWEGSVPAESLEIEKRLSSHFRESPPAALEHLGRQDTSAVESDLTRLLARHFGAGQVKLQLRKDILALGEFHSLHQRPEGDRRSVKRASRPEDQLVLKIELEPDAAGMAASEMRVGDMVSTKIVDARDIAQYLARVFGGHSDSGPVPILAPIEAIESVGSADKKASPTASGDILARVRFSTGVCGDARISRERRLKVVRIAVRNQESHSWWRRFFRG
ncbi:MAG: hypothetical protein HY077_15980 [Elusimicrobia bacterium]|nr:hypothetical protein [Elusimicrobiota bacterium]